MWLSVALFVFFALGAKVALAAAVLYLLLPRRERCACCDGETVATRPHRSVGWLMRAARLESRWCPACGQTELARGDRDHRVWVGEPLPSPAPRPAAPRV